MRKSHVQDYGENQLLCLGMQKQGEVDGTLPGGGNAGPPLSSEFTGTWSKGPLPPSLKEVGFTWFLLCHPERKG